MKAQDYVEPIPDLPAGGVWLRSSKNPNVAFCFSAPLGCKPGFYMATPGIPEVKSWFNWQIVYTPNRNELNAMLTWPDFEPDLDKLRWLISMQSDTK